MIVTALVGLLLPALWPPVSVSPSAPASPVPHAIPLGQRVESAQPGSQLSPAANVSVQITAPRHAIDLGMTLNLTGTVGTPKSYNFSWSGLPPGCPAHPSTLKILCLPNATGNFTVLLKVSAPKLQGSANATIGVYPIASANVSYAPLGGPAPLTVVFVANATGGAPPVAISWITSDGTIGSGRVFNHTFATQGSYYVDLWVNDSTWGIGPNATFSTVIFLNVSPPRKLPGLFGLPDHEGVYILAGGAGVFGLIALYQLLTRRGPKRLPPPERWMMPREKGAGGAPGPEGSGTRPPPGAPPSR